MSGRRALHIYLQHRAQTMKSLDQPSQESCPKHRLAGQRKKATRNREQPGSKRSRRRTNQMTSSWHQQALERRPGLTPCCIANRWHKRSLFPLDWCQLRTDLCWRPCRLGNYRSQ
uniref:(northern house mosquito) hypothetical protein n=1 Tax=Culex pipiens TaxID=7175 RepID=A0A8D8HWH3_CULPI